MDFVTGLLGAITNPPISDDKYVEKVFNWSEVHLSEMTCSEIHTSLSKCTVPFRAAGMYEDIRTGPHHFFRIQLTLSQPGGQIMPTTVLQSSPC